MAPEWINTINRVREQLNRCPMRFRRCRSAMRSEVVVLQSHANGLIVRQTTRA